MISIYYYFLKIKYMLIPYRETDHGDFNEEWPTHRKSNDWWYITGYLRDIKRPETLYSYQYTVINPKIFGKSIYVLHLAFTDMQTGKHSFVRKVRLNSTGVQVGQNNVNVLPFSSLRKSKNEMVLKAQTETLKISLNLDFGKGAFWHCDRGVLVMGLPGDPVQRTVYYSYTNMPTSGSIIISEETGKWQELAVTGKSWFDRQWGPFRLVDTASFWEWFSIRFFDDEEVMLFAFPQHPYYDGTFIDKYGKTQRLNNYKYSFHSLKQHGSLLFSFGWDINLPGIKEENYRIIPLNEGQYNNGYYEIMALVTRIDGTEVGYCFVELLPGVRQKGKKFTIFDLLFHR